MQVFCKSVTATEMRHVLNPLTTWAGSHFKSFDFTGDIDDRAALEYLSQNDFSGATCEEITIRLTNLSRIHEDAFAGNTLVTWKLSLPYNLLTEQVFLVTAKFKKLQVLVLTYNRIEKIPTTAFSSDQRELYKIDLAFNNITAIGNDAFANLPSLDQIILSNNKIKIIGSNAFMTRGMPTNDRPLIIDLEVNSLTSRSFRSESLRSKRTVLLNIAVNHVTVVSQNVFKQIFDSGGVIDMKGNPMTCDCRLYTFLLMVSREKCRNCQCANGSSIHSLNAASARCPISLPTIPPYVTTPGDRVIFPLPRSETDSLQP